jgi:probable selenium-dependent hydroxylase accessory protein YqeC
MGSLCDTLQLWGGGVVSLVGAGGKTTLMFQLARELASDGHSVLTTTTTKIFKPGPDQSPMVVMAENLPLLLEKFGASVSGGLHVTAVCGELAAQNKLIGYPPQLIDAVQKSGLFQWILVEADGARRRPLKAPAAHEPVVPASSGWVIAMVGLEAIGKPLDDQHVFGSQDYSRITGLPAGAPVTTESVVGAVLAPDGILKGFPPEAKRILFLNKAESRERRAAGREIACALLGMSSRRIDRIIVGSLLPELIVELSCDLQSQASVHHRGGTWSGQGEEEHSPVKERKSFDRINRKTACQKPKQKQKDLRQD